MNEPNEIIAEQVVNEVQQQQASLGQTVADGAGGIADIGLVAADVVAEGVIDSAADVAGDVLGGIFDLF